MVTDSINCALSVISRMSADHLASRVLISFEHLRHNKYTLRSTRPTRQRGSILPMHFYHCPLANGLNIRETVVARDPNQVSDHALSPRCVLGKAKSLHSLWNQYRDDMAAANQSVMYSTRHVLGNNAVNGLPISVLGQCRCYM